MKEISWIVFRVFSPVIFLCLFEIIILTYCTTDHDQKNDKFYRNIDPIIYSIDQKETVASGNCHEVIFKLSSVYPPLYWIYNTCDKNDKSCNCSGGKIHINTEWLYNHKAGDVVHFDYIYKSRFIPSKILDEKETIK